MSPNQPQKQSHSRPFRVAFFKTFMAYRCPVSLPFIFLTRNTYKKSGMGMNVIEYKMKRI